METPEELLADLMEGHAERVAEHRRQREQAASRKPHGVTVRRKGERPTPTMAELTGAQRHKRLEAEGNMALNERIMQSPLWDGVPRSRRSWCALLRELELHPDRLERIKAKMAKQAARHQDERHGPPEIHDEVSA